MREVYQALASGAIDGTEWIGPWADEKAGFQEITKIYYTAGFHEPGAGLSLGINRDVFESLTPAQQKIIEIAAWRSAPVEPGAVPGQQRCSAAASAVERRERP